MKIAFYTGRGKILDRLIRKWTKSKYSHVELIINNISYSASPRDGWVRKKIIEYEAENWLIFDLKNIFDINIALKFLNQNLGQKYDLRGIIFSQVFNLELHNKNKYFCSELIIEALKKSIDDDKFVILENYSYFSPERLYNYLNKYNLLSDVW